MTAPLTWLLLVLLWAWLLLILGLGAKIATGFHRKAACPNSRGNRVTLGW